ncbi:retrovirus-related Pol polyprotein from transposon opus [Trichonephila inaurata madagascariensis]|uniref:Retrovirus-related Pol polyprotein from transposon opus n=1 Tax=Trichonephila inaurata madagascariensis TaxID=2747483 RepID=A0A8X6Y1A2_9ARAC|nr:retrovirus-related Pol polyprotein from transposon opus [Trichonephila inaurata madagascariensis]
MDGNHLRKRLRFRVKMMKELRERFRKECLGQLVQCHRQDPQFSNIQIGDIVLIGYDVKKKRASSMAFSKGHRVDTRKRWTCEDNENFTSDFHGTKIYAHIDLVKAYHQIPINLDDGHERAIITPFGLFESTRMQCGLCNASATFKRFIDEVLRNLPFVFAFVDDILITSFSPEEPFQILLTRLQQYGLLLKPSKCNLV